MLAPEDAWQRIADALSSSDIGLGLETVFRDDALGRVLGQNIAATVDQPPADVSAMDGYVARGDLHPGDSVPVVGMSAAGHPPNFVLEDGQIAQIMTGAVVPAGGDRVIPVELTDGGHEHVVLKRDTKPGAHIRQRGEVVRSGQPMLKPGTLLAPGALSLLASHGISQMQVTRRPSLAVMATGDEVINPDQQPGPGQLRDSNTAFLTAAARSMGLDATRLGIAGDSLADLRQKIAHGMQSDVLLLCGGVSMGEYDLVEDVLAELGCAKLFDAVAVQPGKPLVAACHDGGWVFGLPGNPASVMITFWLFVRPTLRRLQGIDDGFWQGCIPGRLAAPMPAAPKRDRFLAAQVRFTNDLPAVTPLLPRGSHDVAAYARGTAIVRARRGDKARDAGDLCEILPLVDWPTMLGPTPE